MPRFKLVARGRSLVALKPVLTRTSSSGTNPMSWSSSYTNIAVGDTIRLAWTANGVDGAGDTHVVTSDDIILASEGSYSFPWTAFAATTFAGGAIVTVKERIERGIYSSAWSNIISDTMTSFAVVHRRSEEIDFGYGGGPGALASPITIQSGDKVVVFLSASFNGSAMNSLTANSGAITFTEIGSTTAVNRRGYAYYADTSGVTSLNLSLAVTGSTQCITVHAVSVQGAAAGAPAGSYFERRSTTNEDPHDVDGGLALPAGGTVLSMVGEAGNLVWSGAIEFSGSEITAVTAQHSAVAQQLTAGNITILGQPSGGSGYTTLVIANVSFSP